MPTAPNPSTDLARSIGAAMRSLRRESRLSQAQVAKRMGLRPEAQPLIGRYETGRQVPGADQLYRYLKAIGLTFEAFGRHLERHLIDSSDRIQDLVQELGQLPRRLPRG